MKTQELVNRVRNEAQHAWENITDQYSHLAQLKNAAFVAFKPSEGEALEAGQGNGKDETHWALLPIDSYEMDDQLVINVEMPGMELADIQISIDGNDLVLAGEKRCPPELSQGDQKFSQEIAYGSFERRFALTGQRLKKTGYETHYTHGVLSISLPYDGEGRRDTVRTITVQ